MNTATDKAKLLLGFAAGVSLGYGLALLTAPDSGEGTRERLKEGAVQQFDNLLARLESFLEKAYNNSLLEEQSSK